ncbi:hypothetical protein RB595_004216 [Gaeumannomyces hyphopodioides]
MASMPAATIYPQSHVGFDSITSQIERKLLKRGFQFNIICVGQTGLGKSTLINTIFASHLIESKGRHHPEEVIRSTTEIHPVSHIIEENGVRLRLNIVDTPGYGDLINNDRCWDPIVKYIKDQHSAYLRKELTAQRERYIQDTRIHCCLFFIQPSGHSLKPIDIVVLKKLSDVVNVVPVIAKADSLTLEERMAFKERIKEEFSFHNLKMYPYDNDDLDEDERSVNQQIKVSASVEMRGHSWSPGCAQDTRVYEAVSFSNTHSFQSRLLCPSPLSAPRSPSSSMASRSAGARTGGASSTSRTRITASLCSCVTSCCGRICRTSSRRPRRFTTRPSVPSSCLLSRTPARRAMEVGRSRPPLTAR